MAHPQYTLVIFQKKTMFRKNVQILFLLCEYILSYQTLKSWLIADGGCWRCCHAWDTLCRLRAMHQLLGGHFTDQTCSCHGEHDEHIQCDERLDEIDDPVPVILPFPSLFDITLICDEYCDEN